MNYEFFQEIMYVWMAIAVAIFLLLLKVTAPYGRHTSSKWGPQISNRTGWILMEAPAMIVLMYYMVVYSENQNIITYILVGAFMFHYVNRTFIFPFRIRTKGKKMPLVIVCSGICFNLVNGFSLGYYFAHFADYATDYLMQPHFIAGIILFIIGVFINLKADNMLIHLRKPGDTGYTIPAKWLFDISAALIFLERSLSGPVMPLCVGICPLFHFWYGQPPILFHGHCRIINGIYSGLKIILLHGKPCSRFCYNNTRE